MERLWLWVTGLSCLILSACAAAPPTDSAPKFEKEITSIQVHKSDRRLYLIHEKEIVRFYDMDLGFAPTGHKQVEGDGKTPEGAYYIDRVNPDSQFHLSLGISYPNSQDIARARALGQDPGGDIFIHGAGPGRTFLRNRDWTAGCIAVTNVEIEEIYANVALGTPVFIFP